MSSRTSLLAIATGIVVSSSAWSAGASVAAEAVEVRAGGLQPVDGTWLPNPGRFDQDMTRYVINDSVLESGLTPGASLVMGVEGNPLPDDPNNEDGYYCDSYDHENCTNRGFTFFSILPPCEQDLTWNCIRSLEVLGREGLQQATLVKKLDTSGPLDTRALGPTPWGTVNTGVHPVKPFPGDPERDLPPGGTVSLWSVPGIADPEQASFFAVNVMMKGSMITEKSLPDLHGFHASVTPVVASPLPQQFAPALVSVRDQNGHVGVGGMGGGGNDAEGRPCLFRDLQYCYVRAEYPEGLRVSLTADLSSTLSGWLHGRLADPLIDIQAIDSRTNRVRIQGEPVEIPVAYRDFVTADLPKDLRFERPVWWQSGRPWFGTWTLFADGEFRLNWFERVMPLLHQSASETVGAWVVRAVVGWELPKCLESKSELVGLVTTDAMMYNGGAPRFAGGRLSYRVAGLHYDPDGAVKRGNYSLVMRSDAARCLYGFDDAPISADISVVSEDGQEQVATTSLSEQSGWIKLTAENFTFSAPTISVNFSQQSAKPIKVVCLKKSKTVKGPKRLTVTGTTASPPKCPAGYRSK